MSDTNQNGGSSFVKAFIPGLIIGFVVGAAVGVIISATGGDIGALTHDNEPTVQGTTPTGEREFGDLRDSVEDAADRAGDAIQEGAERVEDSVRDGVDAVRDAIEDATPEAPQPEAPQSDSTGG